MMANPHADTLPQMPPYRGPWRRILASLLAVGLAAWGVWYGSLEPLYSVLILFVLVVPFEKLFPRHKEQKLLRPMVSTDVGYALAGPVLNILGIIAGVIIGGLSLAWVPGLLLRPAVDLIPAVIKPFVAFALFDFAVYWAHRWYHEVPVLWRFHAIHHSTEHLDWVSGFRNHPLDGAIIAPAFFFLVAAGFTTETAGVITVIQILTGLFLHANVKWRLKWLHKLVITPEFHHWHHTNEDEAIWSNYSTFLPFWDIVFGTYYMPEDKRPTVYGVDEYIPPSMPEQLLHPFRGMVSPWWVLRHPFRAMGAGIRGTKSLLRQMWRSATRPRGHTPFRVAKPLPSDYVLQGMERTL